MLNFERCSQGHRPWIIVETNSKWTKPIARTAGLIEKPTVPSSEIQGMYSGVNNAWYYPVHATIYRCIKL